MSNHTAAVNAGCNNETPIPQEEHSGIG